MSQNNAAPAGLAGLRVLVVEDEGLISMMIEDILSDLGCHPVARASNLPDALIKAQTAGLDAAILDVNLRGKYSFDVAETLTARSVPFVFATGYGAEGIPEKFHGVPVLKKPFEPEELSRALASVCMARAA